MDCHFKLIHNPWADTVPAERMLSILSSVLQVRAKHISAMLERGDIDDSSFGWCVMDPTAPVSKDSENSILALAWVGPSGHLRLNNAIAKAFGLRDHGVSEDDWRSWDPNGVHRLLCADGEFRWPGGVIVDGLVVGGSGFSVPQDIQQNQEFALSFNSAVRFATMEWGESHPREGGPDDAKWGWFCGQNKPGHRFSYQQYLGGNWLVGTPGVFSFEVKID